MTEIRNARWMRHLWWIGAVLTLVGFNALLLLAATNERVFWQFDLDGTRRDCDQGLRLTLLYANMGLLLLCFFSALLSYFVVGKECHWRRGKMFLLGLMGALLSVSWRFQDLTAGYKSSPAPAFPVSITYVLFLGLPFLWALSLAALPMRPSHREFRRESRPARRN